MDLTSYFDGINTNRKIASRFESKIIEDDTGRFMVYGPFLPLSGFSFSNFLNREYFDLKPDIYDLYQAQNIQREQTRRNSFVEENIGEFVYIRVDNNDDLTKLSHFLDSRRDDIEFVVANPRMDGLLRDYSYEKARYLFSNPPPYEM